MWNSARVPSTVLTRYSCRLGRMVHVVMATVAVLVAAATPVAGFGIGSDQVVVPVIVHSDGFNDTKWKSDVWIVNVFGDSSSLTLTYYPTTGGELTQTLSIGAYQGFFFSDIVLETFGMDSSKGMLLVSTPFTVVEVKARIYNTGSAFGEFGQAVPGLPRERLGRQGFISGASTAAGNRLAVGVANPTNETFTVTLSVADGVSGDHFGGETLTLGPHQLVQLDKVAERWNLPARAALVIHVNSAENTQFFYSYASVVRNDTGDASFLFGTTPNVGKP